MPLPYEEDYDYSHGCTEVETPYTGRGTVVEVWCEQVDEVKPIVGERYVRYCPMCGDEINVDP